LPHPRPHAGDRGGLPALPSLRRAPEALSRARAARGAGGAAGKPAAALGAFPGAAQDGSARGRSRGGARRSYGAAGDAARRAVGGDGAGRRRRSGLCLRRAEAEGRSIRRQSGEAVGPVLEAPRAPRRRGDIRRLRRRAPARRQGAAVRSRAALAARPRADAARDRVGATPGEDLRPQRRPARRHPGRRFDLRRSERFRHPEGARGGGGGARPCTAHGSGGAAGPPPAGAPALAGASVTLSIDTAIQLAAERELARAVSASHASGGFAVVIDVESGEILALASNPTFDANKPGRDPMRWRNRAVQDQLEPGSTIKSFVLAAALDRGAISLDQSFYCENGVWAHNGHRIHDTHKVQWATPVTVLSESSNICAAKIGEAVGKEKLVAALRAFGFGERTGIGLPGEGKGSVPDPARMPAIALDTISYGQGMSATGIQTAMAMAAIASGGTLLEPILVKEIVGPDGTVLVHRERKEIRRVLRPETALVLTGMLVEVVDKGTGSKARIAGVKVAGKTGTAQKVDPVRGGYGAGRLASFLGFVPADAPKLTVLVAVDEPEGDVYGGSVAGPAFAAIASEALRQIGLAPIRPREPAAARATVSLRPQRTRIAAAAPVAEGPAQAVVPDLIGLSGSS